MAPSLWQLSITHLGETQPNHEIARSVVVEADSWLAALREARRQLGEEGGVPAGATCVMAPNGGATIVDSVRQLRYVLTLVSGASASSASERPDDPPAAREAGSAPPRSPLPPKPFSRARHTLPYSPERAAALQREFETARVVNATTAPDALPRPSLRAVPPDGEAPGSSVPPPGPTEPTDASTEPNAAPKTPVALPQPATHGATDASVPTAAGTARSEPSPSGERLPVLASRDVEPSASSPLTYRERAFLLTGDADRALLERLLGLELSALQRELHERAEGKYVTLAVFDEPFDGIPMHPPLATLEWMDWRGAPVFTYLGDADDRAHTPAAVALGAPKAANASQVGPVPARGRSKQTTSDVDQRLAGAFEAMPELHALTTPVAALEFTLDLLARLVPAEAISTCLYDIDNHEYRFVVLSGPGASERKASAIPATAGLFGLATQKPRDVLLVREAARAPKFDPAIDGRLGLEAHEIVYLPLRRRQQILGMVQLINRVHTAPQFTNADLSVLQYVAAQLTEFLVTRRSLTG